MGRSATSDWQWDLVLLDRDGTLNRLRPGYRTPGDFELFDEALTCVAELTRISRRLVVVTNQRGLASGVLSPAELAGVHALLMSAVRARGGRIDDILVCGHDIGECGCRKPAPGMLHRALADADVSDLERVVMFGDSDSDAEAAASAGVTFVRVDPERGLTQQDLRRHRAG